jgi:hypothetical protein
MDLGCLVSRKDKTVEEEDDKYKPKKKKKEAYEDVLPGRLRSTRKERTNI